MNPTHRGRLRPHVLIAVTCLAIVPACIGTPDPTFVRAARATIDAIGPEYLNYVEVDPRLDEEQRARRRATVVRFDEAIRAREARQQP